jgi:Beta-ketoacyl synthase, N-terminal domain
MTVTVYLAGVGALGPGLNGWPQTAEVLSGRQPYASAATLLPTPSMLPPAERRRTGRVVKVALAVASEAAAHAGADVKEIASVFSSSGSDGHICHEICQALSQPEREVSPTRFSNSVHNASAGYWSIATGAMAEANVLCAYDASFAAGLLDAAAQAVVDRKDILLVAYDTEYPEPLHAKRPIPDALGIALVLTPASSAASLAKLSLDLTDAPFDALADPALEALRQVIPAARALPLLRLLALKRSASTVIEYLADVRVRIQIEPCR